MEASAEDYIRVNEIINAIEEIEALCHFLSPKEFSRSWEAREEVTFIIRQISIATTQISTDFKEKYSDVNWVSLQELNFHAFDGDFSQCPDALMDVIANEIPSLRDQLEQILVSNPDDITVRVF